MEALVAAAFAAGLLGGVHCAGMCGGIVAGLAIGSRGPPLARQAAFNAGRISTYAMFGAVAGLAGASLLPLQAALFVFANILVIFLGLYIGGWGKAVLRLEGAGRFAWRRIEPLARRVFPVDSTPKALAAGAAWGWVPCGLVYSMLALAFAAGGPAQGALVMAAFGLGTLPTLLAAGLAAQRVLALRRAPWVRQFAALAVIGLGIAGLARIPELRETLVAGWRCLV